MRIEDASVGKVDSFEQRAANALDNCAGNLVAQAVRIDHRSAIKGLHHADDLYFSHAAIHGAFTARGKIAALFESTGNAESVICRWTLFAPAKLCGSGFEDCPQARVRNVLQPELQRIHVQG